MISPGGSSALALVFLLLFTGKAMGSSKVSSIGVVFIESLGPKNRISPRTFPFLENVLRVW